MFKEVTKTEFYHFIDNYPDKLTCSTNFICEPPQLEFRGGNIIVATYYDDYLENDERHYFIISEN